jgi:dihydroorotate dehydrogenase (NAD+) catalytic subunit
LNNFFSKSPDLSVNLGRIKLKNPIIVCSGTFASGIEHSRFYDISKLGAITTKSFSLKKMHGNPPPRIWETASGMLNSIGLQNEGINHFLKEVLPSVKKIGANIILSIFGASRQEFTDIALEISAVKEEISAVELNFSCPNVEKGGMVFCQTPDQIEVVVTTLNEILNIPLIAKLSPNFDTVISAAVAAKRGGAEAVSLVNTFTGTAVDIETLKPRIASIIGGLSGPAVKPIALAKIYQLAKEGILPIIGMGGIYSWQDAIEFLIFGASAVGIGTVNFTEPDAGEKILSGVNEYLVRKNISDVKSLIGSIFKT